MEAAPPGSSTPSHCAVKSVVGPTGLTFRLIASTVPEISLAVDVRPVMCAFSSRISCVRIQRCGRLVPLRPSSDHAGLSRVTAHRRRAVRLMVRGSPGACVRLRVERQRRKRCGCVSQGAATTDTDWSTARRGTAQHHVATRSRQTTARRNRRGTARAFPLRTVTGRSSRAAIDCGVSSLSATYLRARVCAHARSRGHACACARACVRCESVRACVGG